MLGGCVLCKEKNFQREGFSDLTVILCDQCEREFHIGCLRKHKDIDLDGLPEGATAGNILSCGIFKILCDHTTQCDSSCNRLRHWQCQL